MGDTALRAARRRPAPAVVDVGLGVTVAAVVLVAALAGIGPASMANARALDVGAFALAAALAGALGIRRRYPVAALVGLNAIVVLWFVGRRTPGGSSRWLRCSAATPSPRAVAGAGAWPARCSRPGSRSWRSGSSSGMSPPSAWCRSRSCSPPPRGARGAAVGYYRALLTSTRAELREGDVVPRGADPPPDRRAAAHRPRAARRDRTLDGDDQRAGRCRSARPRAASRPGSGGPRGDQTHLRHGPGRRQGRPRGPAHLESGDVEQSSGSTGCPHSSRPSRAPASASSSTSTSTSTGERCRCPSTWPPTGSSRRRSPT